MSRIITRETDAGELHDDEQERTADEHGREAVEAFYQQVTQEQREFLGLE